MTTTPPTPDPRVWRSGTPNPGPVTPASTLDERPEWAEGQRAEAEPRTEAAIGAALLEDLAAEFDDADADEREQWVGAWLTEQAERLWGSDDSVLLAPVPVGHVVIDPAEARAEFWRVFWRRFDREETLDWAIDGSRDALEAAIQAGGLAGEKDGQGR